VGYYRGDYYRGDNGFDSFDLGNMPDLTSIDSSQGGGGAGLTGSILSGLSSFVAGGGVSDAIKAGAKKYGGQAMKKLPGIVAQLNPSGQGGLVRGGHRKHRRMNPLNPRALRRAYSRLNSASRWAHRLFTLAKPHHGVKAKFHHKRKHGRFA
jgi:hypothetical protein